MSEPKLHLFDHAVCDHIVEITRIVAAANPKFGRMIAADLPDLAEQGSTPDLLLSEWELRLIEAAAAFALVRDRWVPDIFAYERWIDAITEIRRGLGDDHVAAWEDYSEVAVDRLLSGERFDVGLEVVREWLGEARKLLRAMERLDLVPRPSGGHATWHMPEAGLLSMSEHQPKAKQVAQDLESSSEIANEPDSIMIDAKQVAAMLDVSKRTIDRMKDSGGMPLPRKVRGSNRWPRVEIEEWIAKGCPSCKPIQPKR